MFRADARKPSRGSNKTFGLEPIGVIERPPRQCTGHRSVGRHSSVGWSKETWTESAHSSVAVRTRSLRSAHHWALQLRHSLLASWRESRTNVSSRRSETLARLKQDVRRQEDMSTGPAVDSRGHCIEVGSDARILTI